MDEQEEDALLLLGVVVATGTVCTVLNSQTHDRRLGRVWSGPITSSRHAEGAFYTTVPRLILSEEDHDDEQGKPNLTHGSMDIFNGMLKLGFVEPMPFPMIVLVCKL